jgi:hypothetical protein
MHNGNSTPVVEQSPRCEERTHDEPTFQQQWLERLSSLKHGNAAVGALANVGVAWAVLDKDHSYRTEMPAPAAA